MKNSTFTEAKISTGTYNTKDYFCKEYSTLSGFKKGLKAKKCPFEIDNNGLFSDLNGELKIRQWNFGGHNFTASVACE